MTNFHMLSDKELRVLERQFWHLVEEHGPDTTLQEIYNLISDAIDINDQAFEDGRIN